MLEVFGMHKGGTEYRRLVAAFERIFGATIFFGTDQLRGTVRIVQQSRFNFLREAQLWYNKRQEQPVLSEQFENVIVLTNEFYQDPSRTDAALFRNLKPGGLLAVIDFPPRSGLPPVDGVSNDHHGHGVSKQIVAGELAGAGFQITNESNNWPSADDYCIIVRKPAGPP